MPYNDLYFPKLKRRSNYSSFRKYNEYRQEIREDCCGRCVYCDAHENEIGGVESMTLDHFRPKDKYKHLTHDPSNLVWACHICNQLKGNLWPAYGHDNGHYEVTFINEKGFIDPFSEDIADFMELSPDGQLKALKDPALYIISFLKLNRIGVRKIRENRRNKYERRQEYEIYYAQAVRSIDSFLQNPLLSEEEKKQLLVDKERLKQQYKLMLENSEQDLNLH